MVAEFYGDRESKQKNAHQKSMQFKLKSMLREEMNDMNHISSMGSLEAGPRDFRDK